MKNLLYCLVGMILLVSCTSQRYIYNPAPFYNPIFTGKNQCDFSARVTQGSSDGTYNASGKNIGVNFNTGYALSRHMTLTAGYSAGSERDNYLEQFEFNGNSSNDSAVVRYKRNLKQFGVGYSKLFHNDMKSFSLFASIGLGNNKIDERGVKSNNYYSNVFSSNSYLISLQPAINFGLANSVGISLLYRFTYVHNYNITTDYSVDQLSTGGLTNIGNLFYQAFGCNLTFKPKRYQWFTIEAQSLFSSSGETKYAIHYARGFTTAGGICLAVDKLVKKSK